MVAAISDFTFDVTPLESVLADWKNAGGRLIASPSQSPAWAETWRACANPNCIAVTASTASGLDLVLVLEALKKGPLTIARFAGGSHANENYPAMSAAFSSLPAGQAAEAVLSAIKTKRPDIDLVELPRLIKMLDGQANSLLDMDRAILTDQSLSFSIKDGFKAVLDAKNGSKKQKKIRQMARRMEERGGWALHRAQTPEAALSILQCFYHLKAKRLADKGIENVFGASEVQAFFNRLFANDSERDIREFELHALEVGGSHVAIAGCTLRGKQFNVEFGAISDADSDLSPGDFLYFHLIEDVCARGFETFSFGTGDEQYKRSWCDIETDQFDLFLPATFRGQVGARIDKTKSAAKRAIKSNAKLFALAKAIRRKI